MIISSPQAGLHNCLVSIEWRSLHVSFLQSASGLRGAGFAAVVAISDASWQISRRPAGAAWACAGAAKGARPGAIWVHAVSVGEVLAVSQLVAELKKKYPDRQIFISTTTATGQALARQRFGEDHVFFMPLDFGFAVRPYLNALQPQMLILAETEFWPNLLRLAGKRGIALATVNARISDRSFPRYQRFRWFFGRVLSEMDLFLTQTEEDASRLRAIGAATERICVSGNLKFDIRPSAHSALVRDLRTAIAKDAPVIVCGSTAEGEEELLLGGFKAVQQQFPAAIMVLAPRHPERFEKVAPMIASAGFRLQRRSKWSAPQPVARAFFYWIA